MKTKLLLICILFFSIEITLSQGTNGCWRVISAGENFSLAIKTDGTLWGWGINGNRLGLGLGNLANQNLPTQIGTDNDWLTVSAGSTHSLAIKVNGTLWSWGNGQFGQLGNGIFNSATPNVTQIGNATDWSSVSAGYGFSLALKTNGTLWGWGFNNFGQLGDNTTIDKNVPVQIGTANDWLRIDAGGQHALGVKTTGTLWSWGNNNFGQLGNGNNTNSLIPIQIGTFNNWSLVSAGVDHSLAVDNSNFLFSWGNNTNGQLGNGNNTALNTPVQVQFTADGTPSFCIAVSAGNSHSLILRNDNSLWSSGLNTSGQLGLANNTNTNTFNQVGNNTNWIDISAGNPHSLVLNNLFDIWSTGRNFEGQLGLGNNINSNILQSINCPTSLNIINQNLKSNLKAYPNPTNSYLKIEGHSSSFNEVKIFNSIGLLINHMNFDKTNFKEISFTDYPNGVYILLVSTDEGILSYKVLKH